VIKEMEEVEQSFGFSRQMDKWDRKCSIDQNKARNRGPESQMNVVPLAHRGGNRKDKAFNSFSSSSATQRSATFSVTSTTSAL
jgi:hypothetical protein